MMFFQRALQITEKNLVQNKPLSVEEENNVQQQTAVASPTAVSGDPLSPTNNLHQQTNGNLARAGSVLLQLQNQAGNRYVQQLVNPQQQLIIQPKLMLGDVNTPSEREADQIASQAMRGEPVTGSPTPINGTMMLVPPETESAINRAKGSGQPLPDNTQTQMSQALGTDLSGVRVHTDGRADSLNQSLQARAFTTGQDIFFRQGAYSPGSSGGQQLLAHELTHVVQQSQGNAASPIQREYLKDENDNINWTDDPLGPPAHRRVRNQNNQLRFHNDNVHGRHRLWEQAPPENQANFGAEVELRQITVTRRDNNWSAFGDPVYLTSGGQDGVFATDQQEGKNAIIEWASNHPATTMTKNGKIFQDKLDKLDNALVQNTRGTLDSLLARTQGFMRVGNSINNQGQRVKYKYTAGKETQTQVNMEVPFQNIGQNPRTQNRKPTSKNPELLFSGASSKLALEVFKKSRATARRFANVIIEGYNNNHPLAQVNVVNTRKDLASLFTIFLHQSITYGVKINKGKLSKDTTGVLFKTGAGDLARTALGNDAKRALWWYAHNHRQNFLDGLSVPAGRIYKAVYKDKGGQAAVTGLIESVEEMADSSFIVKNFQGGHRQNATDEQKVGFQQFLRYDNEYNTGGYSANVRGDYFYLQNSNLYDDNQNFLVGSNPGAVFDENSGYREFDTRELAAVVTGKTFGVSTYGNHKYLIAEIRRNDNIINQLVKGKTKVNEKTKKVKGGLKDEERKKIGKRVKGLQTPI